MVSIDINYHVKIIKNKQPENKPDDIQNKRLSAKSPKAFIINGTEGET